MPGRWSVLILTGGASRRMGQDKAQLTVAGIPLLERLVSRIPAGVPIVIVGPAPPSDRPMDITREEPSGGGPVAAIAAGLRLVDTDITVVCAVDLPFAAPVLPQLVGQLTGSADDVDVVMPVVDGWNQSLCAAYRTNSLTRALAGLGDPFGVPVRRLVAGMRVRAADVCGHLVADVDTPAQLAAARRSADSILEHDTTWEARMKEWVEAIAAELGVSPDVDIDAVLDIAKDAAHKVQRPAAPVTTYLVGMSVASGMTVDEAGARVRALAAQWPPAEPSDG